jgi:hypothetical protein
MDKNFTQIQSLIQERADAQARMNLLSCTGTPEIKDRNGKPYLYIRKRKAGKQTSTYVGEYTDTAYRLLLNDAQEARVLRKRIRQLNKALADLGYSDSELSSSVQENLAFARANIKTAIYDQVVLEGVATTFPQTESILENGIVNGVSSSDVQKIINLKHAWEFILDPDVLSYPTDFSILCHIAAQINEGLLPHGTEGRIRGVPVCIGGTSYIPPLPFESVVKEQLAEILSTNQSAEEKAIRLCLYCMKTQVFLDGNKRAAVIFANHFLISQGGGLLIIPENAVPEFKRLLIFYYEGKDSGELLQFFKENCILRLN